MPPSAAMPSKPTPLQLACAESDVHNIYPATSLRSVARSKYDRLSMVGRHILCINVRMGRIAHALLTGGVHELQSI